MRLFASRRRNKISKTGTETVSFESLNLRDSIIVNMNKLILLYGFAGSGKSTLATKYCEDHPLAISIEGDDIISMMGQWRSYEEEARELVREDTCAIAKVHLKAGKDVVIPYLLTSSSDAEEFKEIAKLSESSFFEIYIKLAKEDAIENLLQRGCWGEKGSPKLTHNDLPEIESLWTQMERAMKHRSPLVVNREAGNIDLTYHQLLNLVQ